MDQGFEHEEENARQSDPVPERQALGEGGLADEGVAGGIGLARDLPAVESGSGGGLALPNGALGAGGFGESDRRGGGPDEC